MRTMDRNRSRVIILISIVLVIDGERWYSATFIENHSQVTPSIERFQTNYIQDAEHRYMPLLSSLEQKVESTNAANRSPILFDLHHTSRESQDVQIPQQFNNSMASFDSALPLTETMARYKPLRYNTTINNIHRQELRKLKKKVIRKRCPELRPRQKKQVHTNEMKTRFLEIFEVVEFDHVPCTASSGLEGTCLHEADCLTAGGATMGTCADGYGTCCVIMATELYTEHVPTCSCPVLVHLTAIIVNSKPFLILNQHKNKTTTNTKKFQFSCEDASSAPAGWFTNPGFPDPSSDRLACAVTIKKVSDDIKQIRLDFLNFELLPPTGGTCEQDQFVVSGQNVNSVVPILCGVNTGLHIYIEVGESDGPINLSLQTASSDNRLFAIKVSQLSAADNLAAPTGCLQYFKDPHGYLESFNYRDASDTSIAKIPCYLNNLNYAMCIERNPAACSITYTNAGVLQILNYDTDGLPVIPPGQAGVEIFNCPSDWLLMSAARLCGDRLNDGSVIQDFSLDAPVTDNGAGPIMVWFRSDEGYVGRGFKLQYQQNSCSP